jgi:hypothetical protein
MTAAVRPLADDEARLLPWRSMIAHFSWRQVPVRVRLLLWPGRITLMLAEGIAPKAIGRRDVHRTCRQRPVCASLGRAAKPVENTF